MSAILSGCSEGAQLAELSGGGSLAQPIYGGQFAGTCDYPATVQLANPADACSGTLVDPNVVVFAAHCGTDRPSVTLGEVYGGTKQLATAHCAVNPAFTGFGQGNDIAYCTLAQPATGLPVVPILIGCELVALRAGRAMTIAGFGNNDQGGYGYKKAAATRIKQVSGNEIQLDAAAGGDICEGDSGGPGFIQLDATDPLVGQPDGAWRLATVSSYGTGACDTGGFVEAAAHHVDWIERDSGLDITPCTDATGAWQPTAACGGFPTTLTNEAGRQWATNCGPVAVTGLSATCGPAYALPVAVPADPNDAAPPPDPTTPAAEPTALATARVQAEARGCRAPGGEASMALGTALGLARAARRRRARQQASGGRPIRPSARGV